VVRFIERKITQSVPGMHLFIHGSVKGAVMANCGAVKGPKGAVVSGKKGRGGLAGPGNPAYRYHSVIGSPQAWADDIFF
jgi:hypothetical protein